MKTITITKPTNNTLLRDEILAVYPAWSILDPYAGLPTTAFGIDYGGDEPVLRFPDEGDEAVIQGILDAHDPSQPDSDTVFRNQIVSLAQSAVGIRLQDLTAAQIKALMACLLYKAGGVDPTTLMVKPLSEWV